MTTTLQKDKIHQSLMDFARRRAESIDVSPEECRKLADIPTEILSTAAQEVTQRYAPKAFNFCSIINAKSGRCTENCAWCSQSRHFKTQAPEYPLADLETVLKHARAVEAAGVTRFSLVTSGRKLSPREVRETCAIVRELRNKTELEICLSAGLLTQSELQTLYEAGVARYHCNLESSPEYFKKLCTTHTVEDKIQTLKAAQAVGMQICSGGIIGMGESELDRVNLAIELVELDVPSIPINVLNPIPGTALENTPLITDEEIVRTVAIFRLIHPKAYLRFAGGRARLSEETQKKCLMAGINSAITGDMLTTVGNTLEHDRLLAQSVGYTDETTDDLTFDRMYLWHPYAGTLNPPVMHKVVGAKGVRLQLEDGTQLIDGTSSWWCALFGYGQPKLIEALQNQAQALSHVMFAGLTHAPAVELGRKLLRIVPQGLSKIFYADSGSVAVEIALKMALQYQQALGFSDRRTILTLRHGYHGDTWNAMSVCDPDEGMHRLFGSDLSIRRRFIESPTSTFAGDWNPADLDELKAILEKEGQSIAAFILEPIVQAAGAMRFYHPTYLKEAAELCRSYGVLLITDEIATGFGRTGRAFACDWAGITPDIMTIGKGLTGGMMTLSAVLTTQTIADTISSHAPFAMMHGPTYMANPLACRVACAALDLFEEIDWETNVRSIQSQLNDGLKLFRSHSEVVDVRVCGAIGVVELKSTADLRRLQPDFVRAGVWVRPFGRLAYLMPPLVMCEEDLSCLLEGFKSVLLPYLDEIAKQK